MSDICFSDTQKDAIELADFFSVIRIVCSVNFQQEVLLFCHRKTGKENVLQGIFSIFSSTLLLMCKTHIQELSCNSSCASRQGISSFLW